MEPIKKYLDLAYKFIVLMRDNKQSEAVKLELELATLFEKLTDEEKYYVDEQVLRLQTYFPDNAKQ